MIYDADMTRPTMFFIGNETDGLYRRYVVDIEALPPQGGAK